VDTDGNAAVVNDANAPGGLAREQARREWALGCAAVLMERNHDSHTLLGGCPRTEATKADRIRLLADFWDIHNREEFTETLESMEKSGHRSNFEKVRALIAPVTDEQFQALLKRAGNPEAVNKLRVVRQYGKQLGSKSLYGWDYSRMICLCRWAYVAGYIDEKEAWERIMPMAILLQERFDSWEDLGRNYLIGRQYWSLENTQEDGWVYEDAVQRLLDMQSSPWNRCPWKMSLTEEKGKERQPPRQDKPQEQTGLIASL